MNCEVLQKVQSSCFLQALSIPRVLYYVVPLYALFIVCDNCGSWRTGVSDAVDRDLVYVHEYVRN